MDTRLWTRTASPPCSMDSRSDRAGREKSRAAFVADTRCADSGADAGAWAALLADAKAGRGDVSAEDAARFEGLGLL